jgi:hypothetical protein
MEVVTATTNTIGKNFSIENIRGNYYILLPVMGTLSALYFYFTGESRTYQQKKRLQSDSIRNGVFVAMLSGILIFIHSSAFGGGGIIDDDVLVDGIKNMDNFTTGLPDF